MSQRELAERVGVTQPTVARWERGDTELPEQYFAVLSDILDIEIGELHSMSPDRPRDPLIVWNAGRLREWNRAVSMSELSIPARAVLNVLSTWIDETHWVSALRPSEVSEKGNIPAEEVEACWAEIVQSPYVEQLRDDIDWWFRLVIPPSS